MLKVFVKTTVVAVVFLLSGCSSMTPHTTSKKARVVFEVPADVDIKKVENALREAVAYRSESFKEREDFLPETLPEKPAAPRKNNMFGSMAAIGGGNPKFEMMQYDVSNAYYSIKGEEDISTPFHSKVMAYVGALYPSKKFYRVYLVVFYEEGSEGVQGALTKMTADALIGSEGAIPFIVQVKEKFLSELPEAKVVQASPKEIADLKLNLMNLPTSAEENH